MPDVRRVVPDDELNLVAATAYREVDRRAGLGPLHDNGVQLSLGESAEQVLNDGQRLGAIEVIGNAGQLLELRILGAEFVPALGA